MYESVLIPLDGSELAEQVLAEIGPWVDRAGTTVHVQTVIPPTDPAHAPTASARAYLDSVAERLSKQWRCPIRTHLDSGHVSAAILERAAEVRADLTVVSDRGGGGVTRWLMGTHAEAVALHAPGSVYLHRVRTPGAPAPVRRSDRVLVPLDGTPESEECIPEAADLARAMGCELMLLRVGVPLQWSLGGVVPVVGETTRELEAGLAEALRRAAPLGVPVRTVLRKGDPAQEILAEADESGARFVAMVPRTPGGVAQMVVGSVTKRVLGHGKVPVLLVTPRSHRKR